jgi:hypothetical protein
MNWLTKRAGVVTVLALVLSAWPLAAMTYCAQFISSGADDAPLVGWLMGESQTTTTKTYSWSYTNFGGTFDGSSTKTQSYTVGTYSLSNGDTITLRCDNYQTV